MANFRLSIKLDKLAGVQVLQTKEGKKFYGIPADAPYIFHGQSTYLRLVAWACRSSYYGDSHFLKADYPREERPDSVEICGNMAEMNSLAKSEMATTETEEQ